MNRHRRGARALALTLTVMAVIGAVGTSTAHAASKRRSAVIGTCRFKYLVAAMDDSGMPGVTDASCMIRNRDALDAARTPTMTYAGRCIPARYQSWHIEAGTFAKLTDGYFIQWRWTVGSDGTHWVDFGTEPQRGFPDCAITARLWS